MKRSFRFIFSLALLLSLCLALHSASALSDPEALVVQKVEVITQGDTTILQLDVYNAGNAVIDEYALALAFVDEEGYQIFGYADTPEGYADEICNWSYEPEVPIAPAETYYTQDEFTGYAGTTEIAVAIRYYHIQNGGYILLPESQWQWIWPGYEAQSGTMDREYYTQPPASLYDSIGTLTIGYRYYLLDDFNAYYYGKNQGGEWITQVEPGSLAAQAGLQPGDLVLFVDAVKPTENLYAVDYASAAIAAGDRVDWVYEREGVVYVTRLNLQ